MKKLSLAVRIFLVFGFFFSSAMAISAGKGNPSNQDICPLHGIKMKSSRLPMVYGMPSQLEFEEMRVGKSLFPYGRVYLLAGCVVKARKFSQGFICFECVKARNTWMASKKRWNELSKASQASLEEFFAIVNSRDVDEAVKSMSPAMVNTPEKLRNWRRHLYAIRSIHVLHVEPAKIDTWNDSRHIFSVTLEAYVESTPDAPIPFFGWQDNPNVRWITMELSADRRWVVAGIAAGP